ncbi:glycoside hydrolase [Crepidotus variabilis]|uniref:alpha-1,2-Mannosidase n=1 Tax=Crepidotus variabilis TaxID=179855 RepID=A0A9P6ECY3_9AGAR|nr:glycoside hydrolase [Crepidotus variabilis]
MQTRTQGSSSSSDVEGTAVLEADMPKRDAVVGAFQHAWSAYVERDAMGCDEYHSISKKGSNLTEEGGIGYTVVDAIDTMQIMGLDEEYNRARKWIEHELTFDRDGNFNTFETTIRVLGGLLSAYHLSGNDQLFLDKAVDLADRMMPGFETPSGLPLSMVNLKKSEGVDDPSYAGLVSTAEAATLQLELKYLSFLTDNDNYWDRAEGVMKVIKAAKIASGLAPIYLDAKNGQFMLSEIRLGSRGDSYYEYLLKQYLQTDKTEQVYINMYQEALVGIRDNLVRKGATQGLTFTIEMQPAGRREDGTGDWRISPKQDHLVCFLGGSLMLGATTAGATGDHVSRPPTQSELTPTAWEQWKFGEEIIKTCMATHDTATGLSPEIAYFYMEGDNESSERRKVKDWYIKGNDDPISPSYDARYILRPETIESLFIAYRLTGNRKYRDQGWKIFQSIEKYCKLEEGGYASILNVDDVKSEKMDKMETFFLSETLKYLYLLFSDDSVIPLDQYVFNTEAHPLPKFTPSVRSAYW